jgi:hypothetical protein
MHSEIQPNKLCLDIKHVSYKENIIVIFFLQSITYSTPLFYPSGYMAN